MKKRKSLKRTSRKNRFAGRAPGEEKVVHNAPEREEEMEREEAARYALQCRKASLEELRSMAEEAVPAAARERGAALAGTLIWGGLFALASGAAWAGLFWLCFAGGSCR